MILALGYTNSSQYSKTCHVFLSRPVLPYFPLLRKSMTYFHLDLYENTTCDVILVKSLFSSECKWKIFIPSRQQKMKNRQSPTPQYVITFDQFIAFLLDIIVQ
uniref:Uncharacterized protein n=1 Tax=Cacopsylla melanoneura TaxID=428564 RepID=A0A8D8TVE2_9HEMI